MTTGSRKFIESANRRLLYVLLGLFAAMALIATAFLHQDGGDKSLDNVEAIEIFDLVFKRSLEKNIDLRRWKGDEKYCVIVPDPASEISSFVETTIEDVSAAYGLSLTTTLVEKVDACNLMTTDVYVLLDQNPGYDGFADMLELITGSRPPRNHTDFDNTLGFMTSLPGAQRRDFVFVSSFGGEDSPHAGNSKSIFLEEFLHVLSGGLDFTTNVMVSQMGAKMPEGGYADWFDENPRAWCAADFLFMELIYGRSSIRIGKFNYVRDFLDRNFDVLLSNSIKRREKLAHLSDERC